MNVRHFWALVVVVVALTAGMTVAAIRMNQWGPHSASLDLATQTTPQRFGLDAPVPDFTLTDINGAPHRLSAAKGSVVVLVVQGDRCPCSAAYVGRLNTLAKDFASKGVQLWAFNPNANETLDETKRFVADHRVAYPTAYDKNNDVADLLGAACTTETWVVDRSGVLRYHGRIDDNIYHPEKVTQQDLRAALNNITANKPVLRHQTRAYACTISRAGGA